MDYFNELLESFNLLKKRKYKLRLDEDIAPPITDQAPDSSMFPQMPVAGNMLMASPYADQEIQQDFMEIEVLLKEVFPLLTTEERSSIPTLQHLNDIFFGPNPTSLESQLAKCSVLNIINNVPQEGFIPADLLLVKNVVANIKRIVTLLTRLNLTETEKLELKHIVGNVGLYSVIYQHGDLENGLVFTSPLLMDLIVSFERKFKFIGNCHNPTSDSDFVSKDPILKLVSVISHSITNPNLSLAGNAVLGVFSQGLIAKVSSFGFWISEFVDGLRCMPLSQYKFIQTLSTFFGKENSNNIQKLITCFTNSINKRKPDMIVPILNGGTYEVYNDQMIGTKMLNRAGFKDSANKLKPILRATLSKECPDISNSLSNILPRAYCHQVNYRVTNDLEDIVVKEGDFIDITNFLSGKVSNKSNLIVDNKLKSIIFRMLNLQSNHTNSLTFYSNSILDLYTKINSLPSDVSIIADSGKFLKENPIKKIINILVADVKRDSLYSELLYDKARVSLLSLADIEDYSNATVVSTVRNILFKYLRHQKLVKDIKNHDGDAINYVLANMLYLGLNVNEGASLEVKVLNTGENFIFSQNAVLEEPINSFLVAHDKWVFTFSDFSIKLSNVNNHSSFIELKNTLNRNQNNLELILSAEFITSNVARLNKISMPLQNTIQ